MWIFHQSYRQFVDPSDLHLLGVKPFSVESPEWLHGVNGQLSILDLNQLRLKDVNLGEW